MSLWLAQNSFVSIYQATIEKRRSDFSISIVLTAAKRTMIPGLFKSDNPITDFVGVLVYMISATVLVSVHVHRLSK